MAISLDSDNIDVMLTANIFEEEGAKCIGKALRKKGIHLKTLNVGDNPIGERGAKSLLEALKDNTTLTALGVDGW